MVNEMESEILDLGVLISPEESDGLIEKGICTKGFFSAGLVDKLVRKRRYYIDHTGLW